MSMETTESTKVSTSRSFWSYLITWLLQESEVPGAVTLLQLLESEISIRGQPKRGQPQRAPRKIRYVLERMTLAGLVSLSCSTLPGRFPKIMSNELRDLRETAGMLEA